MEFRILGPLELVEDGHRIEVSGGRQRTLLALLLVRANEVVSSDRLIDGLWGERPPATAAKVLQNAVSQLRRALGDDLIVTRAPGYVLRVAADAIDARRFEELLAEGRRLLASRETEEAASILREALALWRGRPLDEFAYEPFAEREVARLEELHLRALEERVEADLALGRHADVGGELERIVAEQPLRERPRGQLMLALYRSGRQAEALRVYEDGRRLLAEELGLEPGAALQRLERQILTQDPDLEPPPLVPLPEQRRRQAASETVPTRFSRRQAIGLAATTLSATALLAALLSRGEDAAPTVVPGSLVKIDPRTREIVDVFPVGDGPPYARPAIVGLYAFLASAEREILSRVDVRSGDVDTFGGVGTSPASVAAGAEKTVWVGSEVGKEVWQLDAENFDVLRVIEVPAAQGPWSIAVGGGSVWVSEGYSASVSRFSARTGKLQQRYSHGLGGYSAEVAFGEGASWTAANGSGQSGRLLRVDAAGGGSESLELGRIPYAVAVGFGAVWVSDLVSPAWGPPGPERGKVFRVDPMTANIDDIIEVGKRPSGVATGGGSVWVANGGERTISEIDPQTNHVTNTIHTRYYPHSLTYGHGFLWVSLGSEAFTWNG